MQDVSWVVMISYVFMIKSVPVTMDYIYGSMYVFISPKLTPGNGTSHFMAFVIHYGTLNKHTDTRVS